MSKSPIIFGRINKKLLIPVFLSLTQIILQIVNNFYYPDKKDIVSSLYSLALGQIIIRFLPCILKISTDEENKNQQEKEKKKKQKKCLHYFILCLLFLIERGLHSGSIVAGKFLLKEEATYTDSNLFMVQDFLILSIEMFFMAIFSRCLLKYKYFKHHIISIIIFIVLGIVCEIIIRNYSTGSNAYAGMYKYYAIIYGIKILNSLFDAFYFCYEKYMMEVYYYPYWNIAFIPGIFLFALGTVLLLIIVISPEGKTGFTENFYSYYRDLNGWIIFGKIILVFGIHVILCPLTIITIYYYSPNFILIIFQLSTIVYTLIKTPRESAYCIPIYAVQFLFLLIHLEILELNFCGLNKYTKRNIEFRGLLDTSEEGRDSTVGLEKIDINKDYYIEGEKTTEMEFKNEDVEETSNNNAIN